MTVYMGDSEKPLVSLVILSWNDREDLQSCVNSILESQIQVPWELIIVDNGSTENVLDYLNQLYDEYHTSINLKIVRNSYNMGFTKGNNQALSHIEGKYTLFLNQDIVVNEGAVDLLVQILENDKHQEYGTVAPQLRYLDGTVQKSCRRLPTPRLMVGYYLRGSWDDSHVYDHTQSGNREQAMASALLIRTDLLQDIGGFDESPNMWLYFNDVDLSKKVQVKGYRAYFTVDSMMYHGEGKSTKKLMGVKRMWLWHRGFYGYFRKWHVQNPLQHGALCAWTGISFVGLSALEQLKRLVRS